MVFMEIEGGGKGQPPHGRIRDMLGGHLQVVVLVAVVVSLVAAGMVALVATRHNPPHVAPPHVAPPHVAPSHLAPPHVAISVDDVCAKSMFPQECTRILISDPRNTTKDIFVIADIAIDKAVKSVTSTENKIKWLLDQTNDLLLRRSLNSCFELYDFVKNNLGRANDLIRARDAKSLNVIGGGVEVSGVKCQRSLGAPILEDENIEARIIGNVIVVISNLFDKNI